MNIYIWNLFESFCRIYCGDLKPCSAHWSRDLLRYSEGINLRSWNTVLRRSLSTKWLGWEAVFVTDKHGFSTLPSIPLQFFVRKTMFIKWETLFSAKSRSFCRWLYLETCCTINTIYIFVYYIFCRTCLYPSRLPKWSPSPMVKCMKSTHGRVIFKHRIGLNCYVAFLC